MARLIQFTELAACWVVEFRGTQPGLPGETVNPVDSRVPSYGAWHVRASMKHNGWRVSGKMGG